MPVDRTPYRRAVKALALLAVVLALYPLVRAFYAFEIDYNEGWNGYLQLRAAAGLPLYAGYPATFANNYPPLAFHLIGWLGGLTGDPVLAGRLVSMAALAGITMACGLIVRSAGGSRCDGTLASVTCLLLFGCFATDYLGMNDPQLLGQALGMAGLAVWLSGGNERPYRAAMAALLLAASVLIKHNLILLPLLVAWDALRHGSRRAGVSLIGTGAVAGIVAFALIHALNGPVFLEQLLAPRTWQVDRAFLFTSEVLERLAAPVVVVGLGLIAARRVRPAGLVLLWLVAAIGLGAYFSGGAGTDINVWFDLYLALAVGAGLVAREARARGATAMVMAALALTINAGALMHAPLGLGRFGVDAAGDMAERERLFAQDRAYLAAIPGPALCQSHLLCLRAGKPINVDAFNTTQAILTGRLPADTLTGMIEDKRFTVVQVSDLPAASLNDAPGVQAMPPRFVNLTDDVFAALERHYVLVRVGVSGRFYRPRASSQQATTAALRSAQLPEMRR